MGKGSKRKRPRGELAPDGADGLDGGDFSLESGAPGMDEDGRQTRIRLIPQGTAAANPAFDVTPRRLITGIITERGICKADESDLLRLFPEHQSVLAV